jgi:RHS repeat-associated protein
MYARSIRRLAAALVPVLTATLIQGIPPAAEAANVKRLTPQHDALVPVHRVPTVPFGADAAAAAARRQPPAAVWPTPGETTMDTAMPGGTAARAGTLPVRVAATTGARALGGGARSAAESVTKARVQVLDRAKTSRGARPELLLRVSRADGVGIPSSVSVSVDYSGFRSAVGGDFGNRLRLVALPECALSTPDHAGCAGSPLASRNNGSTVTADVSAAGTTGPGTLLAVQAAPEGSTGDYKATSLGASGTWQAGGSSGDFTWSFPIRVPPGLGGPTPGLGLSYSAQSVDGRTAVSNNQPSWVGEGFDFGVGSIERQYRSCADDMGNGANNTAKSGDQCWATDNAVLSLGGRTVELIRDGATGAFRPRAEDGSRIEHLTGGVNGDDNGEHWKVTTIDGIQYWFGRNRLPGWAAGRQETNSTWTVPVYGNHAGEPCHASTFAASACTQAWRWNLDYVVDTYGNSMSYWYTKETNKYAREATASKVVEYTRGGWLSRIDYGTRTESEFGTVPMRVALDTAERCLANCATHDATTWPDTPFDLECTDAPCRVGAPTFWTTRRLSKITTQVWADTAYQNVESWTLTHSFPNPGDNTRAGLWLASIGHSGLVGGTVTLPDVTFTGVQKQNRVDTVTDQLPPMNWWRINSIRTETGGEIQVNYAEPDCVAGSAMPAKPEDNTKRCYPVLWTPTGLTDPKLDWFHKYVIGGVTETDHTGGAPRSVTRYEYVGFPAWHYSDDDGVALEKYHTWAVWRGYGKVRVSKGDPGEQTLTESLFFRGMDGDKLPAGTRSESVTDSQGGKWVDSDELAGVTREQITYNGSLSSPVNGVISDPWRSEPTATRVINGATVHARFVAVGAGRQRITLDGGRGVRVVTKTVTYDRYGLPVKVNDLGDESTDLDDRCTVTTYARNENIWLLSGTDSTRTYALSCEKNPTAQAQIIAESRVSFDDQPFGMVPTKGSVTRVESISGWSAGTTSYATMNRSAYDVYGRVVTTWDAKGNPTTSAYTPASGAAATRVIRTDPKGFQTVTEIVPAWGLKAAVVDANGYRSEVAYDALGRLTAAWLPGRGRNETGNVTYEYQIGTTGVSVKSSTLTANGGYQSTYELYDGLLRPRQTQAASPGAAGGRVLTDTVYDSAGRAVKVNGRYPVQGAPGTTLIAADDNAVPNQTLTRFDGAGRPTAQVYRSMGVEQWRTSTYHGGDHTDVTPPPGGTATSTLIDGRGRTAELRQYHGPTPTGTYDTTSYRYHVNDLVASVSDPAGNTWSWDYDVRGRKVRSVDPDKGATTFTYNDADELTTSTDARGRTLAYTYDELGRKTGLFEGATSRTTLGEWTYDTVPGGKGKPATSTRWVANNAYVHAVTGYTGSYQVTGSRITIPAVEGPLAGVYDYASTYKPDGSLATTTMPAKGDLTTRETLGFDYDAFGLATALTGTTSYVTDAAYTQLGELGVMTLSANGRTGGPIVEIGSTYELGTRRLQRQEVRRETAPAVIADTSYMYDPAGNLTKIADTPAGGTPDTQCFTHDHLRRLTAAWTPASGDCGAAPANPALGGAAPYWQSWTYDKVGNRLTQMDHKATGDVNTRYTTPAAGAPKPHSLTSTTTIAGGVSTTTGYTYDAAGNTLTRPAATGNQTLTWDAEGHVASVTEGSNTTSFMYDAGGSRLIRRDPAGTTLYLPGMELRLTKATQTVAGTRYYTFGEAPIAQRTAAGLTWLVPDRQGTADTAIDATAGQKVTRRRSTPFGEPRTASPWPNERGFVGGTNDPTGTIHLGAREYDATTGRFTSVDPVMDPADPQQLHGYAYANNSPITYSDPDGLRSCGPDGVLCGYDSRMGTRAQYERERAFHQPGWKPRKPVAVSGGRFTRARNLRNGSEYAVTYVDNNPVGYYIDDFEIDAGHVQDPYQFAVDYDDQIGILRDAKDPINRTLSALTMACQVRINCSQAYAQALHAIASNYIIKKLPSCGEVCQRMQDHLMDVSVLGIFQGGGGGVGGRFGGAVKLNIRLPFRIRCGFNSFDPDTPVLMADGTIKPIKDVRVGDQVVATDPATGETRASSVDVLHRNEDTDLTDVTVIVKDGTPENGTSPDRTTVLHTTQHHPFWDRTLGEWVDAANLAAGHRLRNMDTDTDTDTVAVVEVRNYSGTADMHNLTIADIHTYYVLAGTIPVLVHNTGCGPGEAGAGSKAVAGARGRAPEYPGGTIREDQAMDAAARWLGDGYREVGNGRYISRDGSRVVRYGNHEVNSKTHHIHFESVENGRVVENTSAEIVP